MSDKSQRRSSAIISSAQNSSHRQEGRLSARAAADEAFSEMAPKQGVSSKNSTVMDDISSAFGNLEIDPALGL